MSLIARLVRRIHYLHGVCAFAWLVGVVTSLAVTDIESGSPEEVLTNLARLSVLFALCVTAAYRFRELLHELHEAFVRSQAHLFVIGLLGLVVLAMVGSMLFTRQVRYAVYLGPALIFAQAVLAVFCGAGRGFDRMAFLGLWMIFLQGATGNPHDLYFGCGYLAAATGGLAFSHFHALMARHGSEERQGALGALGAGLLCAACVTLGTVALYEAVPRAYGMNTEYVEPNVSRSKGHGSRPGRQDTDIGFAAGGDASLVRTLFNAATGAGGLALVYVLWMAMRKGGKDGTADEDEERAGEATTIVEDLPVEPSAPRYQTSGDTPRARVILAYNSLPGKLKAHGVERQPCQTPAEFEAEVGKRRGGAPEPMRRLSEIFARAKYSLESISKEDMDAAGALVEEVVAGFVRK